MILKIVGCSLNIVFATFLVKQQTQFQCCICLSLPIERTIRNVKYFAQVLDGHACVSIFAFTFSQSFVGLSQLFTIFTLDANFQESIQILNCTVHLVLSFVDQCDLLVALGFFINIMCSSSHFKTLFKKLET